MPSANTTSPSYSRISSYYNTYIGPLGVWEEAARNMLYLWLVEWLKFFNQICPGGERIWPRTEEEGESQTQRPQHQGSVPNSDSSRPKRVGSKQVVTGITRLLGGLQRQQSECREEEIALTCGVGPVTQQLAKLQRQQSELRVMELKLISWLGEIAQDPAESSPSRVKSRP
ncbi:hypothetical protein BDW74DRAFT_32062 [Aspergillus multicolor]|uniref:uncharacterized protein n=1 Tax=Aspergillus multicolor TaxID=41759 RepID=UPI003CCD3F5F